MRIKRLSWAGIEIEAAGATVVIDLVEEAEPLRSALAPTVPIPATAGKAVAALVTHLHSDHADPAAIGRALAPGGIVLRPVPFVGTEAEGVWTAQAEAGLQALPARVVKEWETTTVGPFEITAVPAVDGLGDPQVSWVVAAEGRRVFHGGDTTFHGFWWLIAGRLGPFDEVFLPINGAAVSFGHLRPASPLPAVLTPEQAAVAAGILGAKRAIPIHYGIRQPPFYVEVEDPAGAFLAAAARYEVDARILVPGQALDDKPG